MKIGTWLKDKETGEAVKVVRVEAAFVHYRNAEVDGQIRADCLGKAFEVLENPPEGAEDLDLDDESVS